MIKRFKDKKILINELSAKDLKRVNGFVDYINTLIEEEAKILLKNKKNSKEEGEFLKDSLKKIRENKKVMLVANDGEKIVGITEVSLGRERQDHVGELGISVRKEYRGIGLGEFLMREILKLAQKRLKPKIFRLSVFANNDIAQNLYKKLGFKKVATIPKQLQYNGKLVDEMVMIKDLG